MKYIVLSLTAFAFILFSRAQQPVNASTLLAQSRVSQACGQYCTAPGTSETPRYICSGNLLCKGNFCVDPTCTGGLSCCSTTTTPSPSPTPATKTTTPATNAPSTAAVTGTTTTTNQVVGDCSGSTPGVKDGIVNLLDVEYFRKELNKEVATLVCDFDGNKVVDVIDFANYIRVGYSKVTAQPTAVVQPTSASNAQPTAAVSAAPTTGPVTSPTGNPSLTPSANARP